MDAEDKVNNFIVFLKAKYGNKVEDLRSNLEEFCVNIQDVLDRVIEVIKDENVHQALSAVGIIGPVFKLGLSVYNVVSKYSKSHDLYFIYHHALKAYDATLEHLQIDKKNDQISENENIRLLSVLFKKVSGNPQDTSIFSHPIVQYLKSTTLEFFEKNNLQDKWVSFFIYFDNKLYNSIKDDDAYKNLKDKWESDQNYINTQNYFEKLSTELIAVPNPIDNKLLSKYYVAGRLIKLNIGTIDPKTGKRFEFLDDIECEELYAHKNDRFEIDDFLGSGIENRTKFIVAPFGNGKTSFARQQLLKKQIGKYLRSSSPWLPIYIKMENGIEKAYGDLELKELITEFLKSNDKKILLICDGLDEYLGNGQKLLEDIDKILKELRLKNNSSGIVINDWKKIVTTRPESGLPFLQTGETFVRLLPFDENQVNEFFIRYFETDTPPLNWKMVSRLDLKDEETGDDLLKKPLFCWMLAISYTKGYTDSYDDKSTSKALLYSNFFHSLLKGKPNEEYKRLIYEKWILRKIALLKAIYKDKLTTTEVDKHLKIFAGSESNHTLVEHINNISTSEDKNKSLLSFILNSYFKIDEQDKRIDFLHKSFQEYFLAEHYIESILLDDRWHRLGIELPSEVTTKFLESILKIIVSDNKYEEFKDKLYKSIYLTTDTSYHPNNKKKLLVDKSKSIIEQARLVYFPNLLNNKTNLSKPSENEKWHIFTIDLSEYHQLLSYLLVPLFIIKKIDQNQNPCNLKEVIENLDLRKINWIYKYFPFANLTNADLGGANLARANLTNADLGGANLTNADLGGANLARANLGGANLTNADLTNANLTNANLARADLIRTTFIRAILLNLNHSKLYGITINENTNFDGSIIDGKELLEKLYDHPMKKPMLIQNKTKLKEILTNKGYSKEQIRLIIEYSRCI